MRSESESQDLTSEPLVLQGLLYLRDRVGVVPERILDPSAGTGVFGQQARLVWPKAHLIGVEPNPVLAANAVHHYDQFHQTTFEEACHAHNLKADLATTNPPFEKIANYDNPKTQEGWRSWYTLLLSRAPLVWLYGKASIGNRIRAHEELFRKLPPVLQARVGGIVRHRGRKVGADSCDYAWWLHVLAGNMSEVSDWLVETYSHLPDGMWASTNLPRLEPHERTWKQLPALVPANPDDAEATP